MTAIHKIKANKGSFTKGVDSFIIDDYLHMEKCALLELVHSTVKNYNPLPVRRTYIKKTSNKNKLRPLGIPTMLDRIIQECIRTIIEPIIEAKLYNHSYGFRQYRGAKHAVKQILHFATVGKTYYAIEGDIKGYFDNINHKILIKKLWNIGIKDKRLIKIISLMLKAGYVEKSKLYNTELGTPQGGIISPLLANLYLNDFDWMVARRYYEPHLTGKSPLIRKERERRARRGGYFIYVVRYADDWIVLTPTRQEAERYLVYLRKYFKQRLKLELSMEKTLVTDLRIKPAVFLGADIIVDKPRGKDNLVAKSYPNAKRVNQQIKEVTKLIQSLKKYRKIKDSLKIIQEINSKLIGYGEYWKTHMCSKTFAKIDYNVKESAYHVFRYLYKTSYNKYKIPVNKLCNEVIRHSGYKWLTWGIKVDENMWYGITKVSFTHTQWLKTPFNQRMTPFTEEGRILYLKESKKKFALNRPSLNGIFNIDNALSNMENKKLYNFEYYMNREYAYNRDKGKCKVCKNLLIKEAHCHHVDNKLPLKKINKVINLAWLCIPCHNMIHNKGLNNMLNSAQIKKIVKYQLILTEGKK